LITTPHNNNIPDTQKTEYDKRRMQNSHAELLKELTPESQQFIKGSNGKRGIILAVSLAT